MVSNHVNIGPSFTSSFSKYFLKIILMSASKPLINHLRKFYFDMKETEFRKFYVQYYQENNSFDRKRERERERGNPCVYVWVNQQDQRMQEAC